MHETGIVRDLVGQVERLAREANARSVSGVKVWLGALSQFSPEHFRVHFRDESSGTVAEGAVLDILTSDDASDPDALHVVLQSIELEVPEES